MATVDKEIEMNNFVCILYGEIFVVVISVYYM